MTHLLNALLAPLGLLSPLAGLVLLSLTTTVVTLLVVKRLSDETRVSAAKRQMQAALFEMRLFNDDLRAILRAVLEVLWSNGIYLRALALPALVVAIPLAVILTQLDALYGYTGLAPQGSALVTARLRGGFTPRRNNSGSLQAFIEVPSVVRAESPAIWFPAAHEIVWKVTPLAVGHHDLRVRIGDEVFTKTLHASDEVWQRAPSRAADHGLGLIFEPTDLTLPDDAAVTSIAISYPPRRIDVLGWRLHWLVLFAGLSLASALVLRRPLGVVI